MTTWAEALQRGCSVSYALTFDGIPYVFAESRLRTVAGAEVSVPANYTLSAALCITEGQSIAHDCDRETGFAAGLELDVLLGRQQLADEGLTSALFARPTKSTYLTSSVTSSSTTTFNVDSTSAFSSTGTVYIGHELVSYTSKTSTTFAGITRGLCGLKHYHPSDVSSGYRQVTDRPVYWVGRFVTLYEHLVSPEGRYFGSTLATVGTYCRELWRGYVVEVPRPEMGGMVIRCAPMIRRLTQEIGTEISGRVKYHNLPTRGPYIYTTSTDQLRAKLVSGSGSHDVWSQPNANGLGFGPFWRWSASTEQSLQSQIGSGHRVSVTYSPLGVGVIIEATGSHGWILDSTAWFAPAVTVSVEGTAFVMPFAWGDGMPDFDDCWLVVELDDSDAYVPASPTGGGLMYVTVGEQKELVYYSEVDSTTGEDETLHAFHIVRRGLNGVRVNPYTASSASVTLCAGNVGDWQENLLTMATSSGLASERGSYDALTYGYGLGIPGTDFGDLAVESLDFAIASTSAISLEDVLGGHLVLSQFALAPRQEGGVVGMEVVSTRIVSAGLTSLPASDVLLTGHGAPQLLPSPNQVRVTPSGDGEGDIRIIRDASRVQNEGLSELEIALPPQEPILGKGASLLANSDGLAAVDLEVPPWVTHQIGDALDVTTAHPMLYDWATGAWGAATTPARVVGHARDLWSGTQKLTLIIGGQVKPSTLYCPSAIVTTAVSTTELRIDSGLGQYFTASSTVAIYKPGDEATQYETRTIASITTGTSYDTITLSSALSAVTAAAGIVITYPDSGSASVAQLRYMYEKATYFWR